MRIARASVLAALLAGAALAATDPWDVPAPDAGELMLILNASKRTDSYTILLAGKQWAGANGPERVELTLPKDEKDDLARARDLVAKGDHDGAATLVDAVLAKNPANWDAFLVRASSLHAKKADADAIAALRASLIGNRRNPDAWKLLDDVAKALGKKVARPKLDFRGWVRELPKHEIELGYVADDEVFGPWLNYVQARAVYRWEGPFARDFPGEKAWRFTFREQMYAMGVLATAAAGDKKDGAKLPPDLVRVLAEKKAGTLAPFAFFAAYPEPLTATPEKDFDLLRPRLEKYFDEKILVKR